MSVFDRFRTESGQDSAPDWTFYPFSQASVVDGRHGTFAKLLCHIDDGEDVVATCDHKNFDLLAPYLEELEKWLALDDAVRPDPPVIPIFFGSKNQVWKFSELGARRALSGQKIPQSATTRERHPTADLSPFRLQITVTKDLARRFEAAASFHRLTRSQYLLNIIEAHAVTEKDD